MNKRVDVLLTTLFAILGAAMVVLTQPALAQSQAWSLRNGTSDPAACRSNSLNVFFNTTSGALKLCTALNTWSAIGGSGANPAGSGSEVQYRAGATSFGALTGSSVSGADLTLGGALNIPTGVNQIRSAASDGFGFNAATHGPSFLNSVTGFSLLLDGAGAFSTNRVWTFQNVSDTVVGLATADTLTNKTLTTPTIASFANAPHNHTNAAGGGQITDAALSAAVTVAKGGTGLTTLTANNVILGNATSTPLFVAPGASGNVLTSNGTTWTSAAAASSGANTALSNLASVAVNAPIATGAGTTLALSTTAPAQQAATAAGTPITITSSGPTVGSSTTLRQPGGAITITAADCAGVSGNCDGASVIVHPGFQAIAGTVGALSLTQGTLLRLDSAAVTTPYGFCINCVVNGSVIGDTGRVSFIATGSEKAAVTGHGLGIGTSSCLQSGTDLLDNNRDTNLCRDSAGVWRDEGGGASGAAKGGRKLIADSNGSYALNFSNTELLTLSLGGTTTATSANLCPVGSRIKAILYRVTTTITGTASFQIAPTGLSSYVNIGTATALQSTLTAGTTGIMVASTYGDGFENTANTVTVTTTATAATAGVIRITVVYEQYSAPAS
jgi:hypothetical protein